MKKTDYVVVVNNDNCGNGIELAPIKFSESYSKKWNIYQKDFVVLVKNGIPINDSIYRIGGVGGFSANRKYNLILKYVEDLYEKNLLSNKNRRKVYLSELRHLGSLWCIVDNEGNEIMTFPKYATPYLIDNSCIYTLDSEYYNIITGQHYGSSSTGRFVSRDYIFIDCKYNEDVNKRGVLQINKNDGTYLLFPSK